MAKKAPLKRKCVVKNTCIVLNLIVLCFPSRRVPKKPKWEPWSPQMMASSNTDLDPKSYVNQGDPRMNTKAALKARKGQWLLPSNRGHSWQQLKPRCSPRAALYRASKVSVASLLAQLALPDPLRP